MTIDSLFRKRTETYYKKLGKYMKYILNDHFVILLLILGGALGFAYQDYLDSVQLGAVLPRVFLLLIVLLLMFTGSIRTLVEPADAVFLLPEEQGFNKVMKKNFVYSSLFFSVIAGIVGVLSLPLLSATGFAAPASSYIWIFNLIFWKVSYLIYSYYRHKRSRINDEVFYKGVYYSLSIIGLVVSLFYSLFFGFILSVIVLMLSSWYVFVYLKDTRWNWEKLIETEQKRVQVIYSVINLFIETPYASHKVKRLRIFDPVYSLSLFNTSPEIYYLSRTFLRNINFSGLFLRLLIIGAIFIYFTEMAIVRLLISLLFLYLIGFQLIPLRQSLTHSIHFKLYPSKDTDTMRPIQKLVYYLLIISGLFFVLASGNMGWMMMLMMAVANLLFIWLFVYIYIPRRLRS